LAKQATDFSQNHGFPEYQHSKDVYGCKGRVKDVSDPSFDNVNFNYSDQIKIDGLV